MYKKEFNIDNFNFNIDDILKAAWMAGKEIMEIYQKDFLVEYKDDKSPLTEADKRSHNTIMKFLEKYNIPVLSEEGKEIPYEKRKEWDLFWMIDPLDGTKEFIKKNGEFTINIALINKNKPIFGVVYAPAIDTIYFTDENSSYKANLSIEEFKLKNIQKLPIEEKRDKYVVVASKSHLNEETKEFIENIKIDKEKEFISIGSSLKLCLVAEGKADIYPRLAPTMEWDTAAADVVVRKTGRKVYQLPINDYRLSTNDYRLLVYNKENLLNPYFVVE